MRIIKGSTEPMRVKVYVINEGTSSQYYGLKNADENTILTYAPNNWKSKRGAENWAKKHGFTVVKSSKSIRCSDMRITIRAAQHINVKIRDSVNDAYDGDVYGTIYAFNESDDIIGSLEYIISDSDNTFFISMIQVSPNYQRMGIATKLCNYAKQNYGDYDVDWGYTTDDGAALKRKLCITYENPERAKAEERISDIKERMREIESIMDSDDYDSYSEYEISSLGDEWNDLNYELEEISNDIVFDKKRYVTRWR